MRFECLPFTEIPGTSRLFLDFLSNAPPVRPFYPASTTSLDDLADRACTADFPAEKRQTAADILERQNRKWNASDEALRNIARLRLGACAVVTGQQVGLFLGPAYTLYKAITAIRIASELTARGVDAVPIFWLASEDHDLLEVNHVFLPDGEGQLRRLETASKGQPDSPVATVALSPDVADLLQQATELAGDSQAIDLVRAAYQPGRTFSEAFALLMTSVFSRSGLILLDPADAEFHRAGAPLLEQAAERTHEITESLLARNQELDAAGYHAQVNVTASSMLLFFLQNGARVPVHRKNCNFTVNGEQWNTAQLRKKIVDAPELFSANVLLRPVLQDFLLPTAAYIAGPAEAAYFAQAQVVYEHLLGRSTPVLPRFSATLIEPRLASWMRKYGLRLRDVLQPRDEFVNALARRTIPADLKEEFDRSNEHLDRLLAPLLRSLDRLDPSIGAAGDLAARKMRYQLKRLEARAARAHLRREEVLDRHAGLLSSILFPEKELQERKIAGIYFLARLGTDLVDTLVKEFRPECRDHQVTSVL